MSAPTISVVLPNFNHARYLPVSLGALAAQADQALEIIVVDDGSTDDSLKVIGTFIKNTPNMKLIRHEKNRGLTAAWNTGVGQAKGDFVTIPGADDEVLPGFLARSREALRAHPEAGLCTALAEMMSPEGTVLGPYETPVISRSPRFVRPDELLPLFKKHGNWFVTQTVSYRRADVLALGGWNDRCFPGCDGVLSWLMACRRGVCFLPERLARWRKRADSLAAVAAVTADEILGGLERREAAMAKPIDGAGVPREILDEMWTRSVLVAISELLQRPGTPAEELRALARRLPGDGFFKKLTLLVHDPRAAAKMLIFAHEPCSQKAKLVARRLKMIFGGRA